MPFKDRERLKGYFQEYNQRPERKLYRQLWYLKKRYPEASEQLLLKIIELRSKRKSINRLKKQPPFSDLVSRWKYQIFYQNFKTFRVGYRKDGSNVHCPKLLTSEALADKKYLKIIKRWKFNRNQRRQWKNILEFNNAGIVLGLKNSYKDYRLGCIDIDVKGYTNLFRYKMYVSNRIGSVHFYFLYRNKDVKSETGKKCVKVNDFKADFKVNGYVMSPLSLHRTGRLYEIKGMGDLFIGKFERASEARVHLQNRVEQFQFWREIRKVNRQSQNQIEIPVQQKY